MRILVVEDERLLCDGIAEDLETGKIHGGLLLRWSGGL